MLLSATSYNPWYSAHPTTQGDLDNAINHYHGYLLLHGGRDLGRVALAHQPLELVHPQRLVAGEEEALDDDSQTSRRNRFLPA